MALAVKNFDTLHSFDRLKSAGVAEKQARAIVEIFEESVSSNMESLATKAELQHEMALVRTDFRQEMSELRAELRGEMSELRAELHGEMSEMKTELRGEMSEMKIELRTEMSNIKTELCKEMSDIKTEVSGLTASMGLMQKLFFSSIFFILLNIAVTVLHH